MGKVSFTVSARTAKLIVQENFATSEGAIVELVKNCYDADAKNCIIIFSNKSSQAPVLYILDNGVGMTNEVIRTKWMQIGTDDKVQNFESTQGRVKTGAKGIGRFALDRLGLCSKMFTLSNNPKEGSIWEVRWSDFDQVGLAIDEVSAELTSDDSIDLKQILYNLFSEIPQIKNTIDQIEVGSGTLLEISPLKDRWETDAIKSLYNNLEVLIPPKEQPEFKIHLFSTIEENEFGEVNSAFYDDFDYKVYSKYNNEEEILSVTITRNELKVDELESTYNEIFASDLMSKHPYTIDFFKEQSFTIKKPVRELSGFATIENDLLKKIGDFEFTFYFLKNTLQDDRGDGEVRKKYPYKYFSSANRKAWLKKFGGIKMFRDDFRIRPYGENGQDWLGLGDRQAKSPGGPGQKLGGYRIGPNQIAGTVSISRIANPHFQDKSGREGIQENEVFDLFKNLLLEIISLFERDRNVVMYSLSELAKARFKDEEEKRRAKAEADRILKEEEERRKQTSPKDGSHPSQAEILLAKAARIYEQEISDKNEEIKLLRGLASVGLIITSFAHELKGLRARLTPRTEFLKKELHRYISDATLSKVSKEDNPFYMLDLIQQEDVKLKHWLEYSLSSLKRDKRTRQNINIGEYFERFSNTWSKALEQRKVSVILNGTKDPKNVIRAFEVDLDAVFNNLLSNSLSAFKERKGIYQRIVEINWHSTDEYIEIIFSDNGAGLAKEYHKDPDRIFEYNESSKRDRVGNKIGTGMGLYIVSLVMSDYNDSGLSLRPTKQGFSIAVTFAKRKQN